MKDKNGNIIVYKGSEKPRPAGLKYVAPTNRAEADAQRSRVQSLREKILAAKAKREGTDVKTDSAAVSTNEQPTIASQAPKAQKSKATSTGAAITKYVEKRGGTGGKRGSSNSSSAKNKASTTPPSTKHTVVAKSKPVATTTKTATKSTYRSGVKTQQTPTVLPEVVITPKKTSTAPARKRVPQVQIDDRNISYKDDPVQGSVTQYVRQGRGVFNSLAVTSPAALQHKLAKRKYIPGSIADKEDKQKSVNRK